MRDAQRQRRSSPRRRSQLLIGALPPVDVLWRPLYPIAPAGLRRTLRGLAFFGKRHEWESLLGQVIGRLNWLGILACD